MSIYPGVRVDSISVGGATVHYYDGGESESERPPVVLIHGTGGKIGTHFFTVYPMLASRHRVIGIDLSDANCDSEDPTAPLTVAGLARQVVAVLNQVGEHRRFALVGYSLGAAVAIEVAAQYPKLVESLVLLNGWAKTDNALRLRLSLWHKLRNSQELGALAEFMMLNIYSRAYLNVRKFDEILQLRDAYAVGPGSDRQMALNLALDVSDRLPLVKARTLVVASKYDQLVPDAHSFELFGGIAKASLADIACGHASVTERPAEVFRLIDRYVRDSGESLDKLSRFEDPSLKQLNAFVS